MKFSTSLPGVCLYPPITQGWEAAMGAEDFQRVARAADELGFDSIAVPEHVALPVEMVELMGPFWTHAMTVMSFVAGATSRIVVDSCVIVLPYHDPVVLAKAVSTLDRLSGGRVRLSIGVGHAEREFEVLRVPFHERGRLTDEYLDAMVELWTSDDPVYKGRYVSFERVAFEPKPVQKPYPPIWVGGNSQAAMRRAARHDGWYPWLIAAEELPPHLEYIRGLPEYAGRGDRPFDVCLPVSVLAVDEEHRPLNDRGGRVDAPTGTQAVVDAIGRLGEIGVTWTSVPMPPARSLVHYLEGLQRVAEEVLPQFR
ncbi:MAG TPA: LLM class flavin-dependent oxidoreductase [Acidimicrobiales bacterium]|nr:LLM class flavin-dependent oxidoreductase [Acidimicrobiales bacterium]